MKNAVHIEGFEFGSICIDGRSYDHDVVLRKGSVSRRKKKHSKAFRAKFGHTPLSLREDIPWDCERLVVGTGAEGALPVMDEVRRDARRRGVRLVILKTPDAISEVNRGVPGTNAILHVTC
jgi:hypothetical protein